LPTLSTARPANFFVRRYRPGNGEDVRPDVSAVLPSQLRDEERREARLRNRATTKVDTVAEGTSDDHVVLLVDRHASDFV
jgi:hypothetical protein